MLYCDIRVSRLTRLVACDMWTACVCRLTLVVWHLSHCNPTQNHVTSLSLYHVVRAYETRCGVFSALLYASIPTHVIISFRNFHTIYFYTNFLFYVSHVTRLYICHRNTGVLFAQYTDNNNVSGRTAIHSIHNQIICSIYPIF